MVVSIGVCIFFTIVIDGQQSKEQILDAIRTLVKHKFH